ncbi:MAG: arylformamidase [Sneathiella sp.]
MTRLYDISQTLRADLPVWPGDTAFDIETTWHMSDDCPVLVSKLTLSTHSGTHADAPSHYDPTGIDMAKTDLLPYLGPCSVVAAPMGDGPVTLEEILPRLPDNPQRLLIRTFDRFPHEHWPDGFRAIEASLIDHLAHQGCHLIGTDTPSLDPETSKTLDAHNAVQKAGMAILEGLVLDAVPPGDYELIALPLKIQKADASPVRAILRSHAT